MNPLVSIIIPTYNRAHLIGETLDSIISQIYMNWECIVVDDGSTDNTEELLKDYCKRDTRFQYFSRPNNYIKGPNSCRNYGFEQSKGIYINWFDDDDVMQPGAIEKRIKLFESSIDVVICKLLFYDFESNKEIDETNLISDKIIEDYLIGNVTYFVSGPIWKREFLLKQKHLFNVNISNLDDWDFNLRMLYSEPKILLVNEALIKYRIHNNSLSRKLKELDFKEIKSECRARLIHLKLLLFNYSVNTKNYKKIIIRRNKNYLLQAFLLKNDAKYNLFKTLIICHLLSLDVKGLIKSCLGFISFSLFNRGYIFLK